MQRRRKPWGTSAGTPTYGDVAVGPKPPRVDYEALMLTALEEQNKPSREGCINAYHPNCQQRRMTEITWGDAVQWWREHYDWCFDEARQNVMIDHVFAMLQVCMGLDGGCQYPGEEYVANTPDNFPQEMIEALKRFNPKVTAKVHPSRLNRRLGTSAWDPTAEMWVDPNNPTYVPPTWSGYVGRKKWWRKRAIAADW